MLYNPVSLILVSITRPPYLNELHSIKEVLHILVKRMSTFHGHQLYHYDLSLL